MQQVWLVEPLQVYVVHHHWLQVRRSARHLQQLGVLQDGSPQSQWSPYHQLLYSASHPHLSRRRPRPCPQLHLNQMIQPLVGFTNPQLLPPSMHLHHSAERHRFGLITWATQSASAARFLEPKQVGRASYPAGSMLIWFKAEGHLNSIEEKLNVSKRLELWFLHHSIYMYVCTFYIVLYIDYICLISFYDISTWTKRLCSTQCLACPLMSAAKEVYTPQNCLWIRSWTIFIQQG